MNKPQNTKIRRIFDANDAPCTLVATIGTTHDAMAAARKERDDYFDDRENRNLRRLMTTNTARFI